MSHRALFPNIHLYPYFEMAPNEVLIAKLKLRASGIRASRALFPGARTRIMEETRAITPKKNKIPLNLNFLSLKNENRKKIKRSISKKTIMISLVPTIKKTNDEAKSIFIIFLSFSMNILYKYTKK